MTQLNSCTAVKRRRATGLMCLFGLLGLSLGSVQAAPIASAETDATVIAHAFAPSQLAPAAPWIPYLLSASDLAQSSLVGQSTLTQASVGAGANESSGRIQQLLQKALTLLGTPYRWGGTSPQAGFDCSGLVGYVFRSALGIELPRVSSAMAQEGMLISDRAALSAGDLVFFSRGGKRVDHVGIYVGDGQFVHAPRTGKEVQVDSLASGYWSGKFMQARRLAGV